ncbi:ATP-dependent zinc metalloprotease FtsH [Methanobrevibacter curvatus]|uniref:ATP-dependent zinc metalloprotease FtsH n=1 Tax=Methanobrevibacter curvatus TaxID=49547 RepID=A0A166BVF9_9EURY|nr:AAA family ATPase [Methanobrevibacter curvatus]KZX13854.1 ATP-dependent zinc metalloprotease FtsH [Methanobrevibacter curvatus]
MKINNNNQTEHVLSAGNVIVTNFDKKQEAKVVVIEEAGLPFKLHYMEVPKIEISNKELFEHYARDQWYGAQAIEGNYLFDQKVFPDFGFKMVSVTPNDSIIGDNTTIILLNEKNKDKLNLNEKNKNKLNLSKFKSHSTMDDIIGQVGAKSKCRVIEKYLKNSEEFGIWAPKNILFYGPPGTGKTMMVQALSNKLDVQLFLIKATTLIGDHVGDGSRQIHDLFENAKKSAPAVIFIDEIDAIALNRKYQSLRGDVSEIVNALLSEMDGFSENLGVITIAATNNPEQLDLAVRSRFEDEFEFSLPNENERTAIFKKYMDTLPIPVDETPEKLAKLTKGFSGRDIKEKVLKSSLHMALSNDKNSISSKYISKAIDGSKKESKPPKAMFV